MTLDILSGLRGQFALRNAMEDYQQGQESATTLKFASDITANLKCATKKLAKVRRTLCRFMNYLAAIN